MARLVMHAELAAEDVRVGRKRVARLMRKANIEGVHRRRRISTTRRDPAKRAAPDLVKRRFRTQGPDRIWAADITYVPTQAGFLYLAVVIDLWSRKVVGWSMRSDLTTPLVTDALDMAISQRKPNGVIFHSDQGQPIQRRSVHQSLRAAGDRPVHGKSRLRFGQRRRRVVFLHPPTGTNQQPTVCHQNPSQTRHR